MTINLGVTVVEVDGKSSPAIVSAPTSTAGFLVRSARGAPDRAVRVRGFGDFVSSFGGYTADAFGAYAVRGFFDNGGSDAYVVRVVGAGAQASTVVLNDQAGTPVPTLRLRAGARGVAEPGAWGDALSVAVEPHPLGVASVPAQVVGGAVEPFALTDGATAQFTVTTRGVDQVGTVTFHAADFATIGAASAQEVAAVINRKTTAVRAAVTPDGAVAVAAVATDPRVWSRLAVTAPAALGFTGGNANSDGALAAGRTVAALSSASGFRIGSAVRFAVRGHAIGTAAVAATVADGAGVLVTTDGGPGETIVFHSADFANPAAITVAEVAAAINRQAVAFSAEVTHNNRLALLSNRDGSGSTIALAAPGSGGDARTALGLAGATPVAGSQTFRQLTAASETYRLIGWGSSPAFPALPAAAVRVSTVEFDLVVRRDGAEVERFGPVSMVDNHDSYVEAVVNDPRGGSAYLVVTDLGSASGVGLDAPGPGVYSLTGGDDGADPADTAYLGDPAQRTGLEAFNEVAIQLLACPESTSIGVAAGAIGYCERRGDAMFVGTVPYGFDREGAKAYAAGLRGRKVFGALYGPWIQVVNPDVATAAAQPLVWVPPVGQVLGTYARIADARGVWKAPAGDEARLCDALGVEYDMTDADHTDLVRNGGVNGIRALPGAGIVVDASRTLSTDTRWLFVNVRRLFNFVKTSLRDGLTWVAQEPHDEALRRMVRFNVVTPFLLGLWRQGAFGSDPAEQVFTVKCDAENNSPADVANGFFTLEVYFYPAKPAEAILIVVGQQDSGATATDG
ncbi:phage tail sheath C-terminal domain-containing protein [Micromonospora sp. NPDC048999]|uniref:phage tail sheath family protein n=1 Tax=Micromonospora sp. NPDC048999 TaxID=3155391 RepID=UPI00340EDDF9